jgi:cell division transport system permease protein
VDQKLHSLFEQALADEPAASPADLAQVAMAEGTRLRRRRRLVAGGSAAGVLAVFATIVALNVGAPADKTPPVTAGVAALPQASQTCAPPAPDAPVNVIVVLQIDITARQQAVLDTALRSDPAVSQSTLQTREQAYANFKELWRNEPAFVKSISPEQFPEIFRVTLANPSAYPAFAARVRAFAGTEDVNGLFCGAEVGE